MAQKSRRTDWRTKYRHSEAQRHRLEEELQLALRNENVLRENNSKMQEEISSIKATLAQKEADLRQSSRELEAMQRERDEAEGEAGELEASCKSLVIIANFMIKTIARSEG